MRYQKITRFDTANGPGIRTVLWVSGCSHRCRECQNPETWDPNSGDPFDTNTIREILDTLSSDYIDGVTISGGDPLYFSNLAGISLLVSVLNNQYPNKTIWLYTGYTWEEILSEIADGNLDLLNIIDGIDVLVDGRFKIAKKDISLPYCGSTNQRVIDVKKTLCNNKVVLYEGTS